MAARLQVDHMISADQVVLVRDVLSAKLSARLNGTTFRLPPSLAVQRHIQPGCCMCAACISFHEDKKGQVGHEQAHIKGEMRFSLPK